MNTLSDTLLLMLLLLLSLQSSSSRQCIKTIGVIPYTSQYPSCSYSLTLTLCEVHSNEKLINWNANITGIALSVDPLFSCLHSTESAMIIHYYSNVSRRDIEIKHVSLGSEEFYGYAHIKTIKSKYDIYHKISIEAMDKYFYSNFYDIVFRINRDSSLVEIIESDTKFFKTTVSDAVNTLYERDSDNSSDRTSTLDCTCTDGKIDGQWNIDQSKCHEVVTMNGASMNITRCIDYATDVNVYPDDMSWSFYPDRCQLPRVHVHAFMADLIKYNISSIMYIGTSRVRTLYYDLLFFLEEGSDVHVEKAHMHLKKTILYNGSYPIDVHFHWLDCTSDVNKRSSVKWVHESYAASTADLLRHFQEVNVCSSNDTFNSNGNGKGNIKKSLVLLVTGICELDHLSTNSDLNKYYVDFLSAVEGACHTLAHLLVESEMSSNYHYWFHAGMRQFTTDLFSKLVPGFNRRQRVSIPIMDAYHATRYWISNGDWVHYYNLNNTYRGNVASLAVSNMTLHAFLHTMNTT